MCAEQAAEAVEGGSQPPDAYKQCVINEVKAATEQAAALQAAYNEARASVHYEPGMCEESEHYGGYVDRSRLTPALQSLLRPVLYGSERLGLLHSGQLTPGRRKSRQNSALRLPESPAVHDDPVIVERPLCFGIVEVVIRADLSRSG